MKLTHPRSDHTVETDNPEPYLAQGWVEAKAPKKTPSKPEGDDDK